MDREFVDKIWNLQRKMEKDPAYQELSTKREAMNLRFLSATENMTKEQEAAVLDYLGYLLEIHYITIEYLLR